MKKLVLILLLFVSTVATAQTTLQLIDKNDYQSLVFKRRQSLWVPTWDNNGNLFYMPDILDDPKIADLLCLIDSLTEPGVYVPLSENLRFYNNTDKLDFIEFCSVAGVQVQQNNIGDVIITWQMYTLFELYPAIFEDALTKAELIDRAQELLNQGVIWPISDPTTNTPIYTGCN